MPRSRSQARGTTVDVVPIGRIATNYPGLEQHLGDCTNRPITFRSDQLAKTRSLDYQVSLKIKSYTDVNSMHRVFVRFFGSRRREGVEASTAVQGEQQQQQQQ